MTGQAISTPNFWALRDASIRGDLATLKLSLKDYGEKIGEDHRSQFFYLAIYHGHIEIVIFFVDILNKYSLEKASSNLYVAAEQEDATILLILIETFNNLLFTVPKNDIHLALSRALDKNRFENFKILFKTYRQTMDITKVGSYFTSAATHGFSDFLNFLMDEFFKEIDSESVKNAFRRVAERGNIDFIKILFEKFDNKITDEVIVEKMHQIFYDYPELSNRLLENERILHLLSKNPALKQKIGDMIHASDYFERHVDHLVEQQCISLATSLFDHFVKQDLSDRDRLNLIEIQHVQSAGDMRSYLQSKNAQNQTDLKAEIEKLRSNPVFQQSGQSINNYVNPVLYDFNFHAEQELTVSVILENGPCIAPKNKQANTLS